MSDPLRTPVTEVVLVEDPTYLAREINYAHRQVVEHGKTMLTYAAEAGKYLIAVKGMLKHGEFQEWIADNCDCSYEAASKYMRVSRLAASKNVDLYTFEGGIHAFLDACAQAINRRPGITECYSNGDILGEAASFLDVAHSLAQAEAHRAKGGH